MTDKTFNIFRFCFIIVFFTIPVSFVHSLINERQTCNTFGGYYLPVTYLICKLSEPLK